MRINPNKCFILKILPHATKYLKKLKDKQLKELYHDAIANIRKNPLIGEEKYKDFQRIRSYDFYYKKVKYELTYTLVFVENEEVVVIVISAGLRENFYDDLRYVNRHSIKLLKWLYEKLTKKTAPYYYNYSLLTIIKKPLRKWITNSITPRCPFNCIRIFLYRLCGFKIGKRVFIGMHCYLDDMCYDLISICNDVTISYGVYFACHGKNQGHYPIKVEDGAYIGMRASIISKNSSSNQGIRIGRNSIIGACTLVNRSIPNGMTAVGIPCRIL